MPRIVSITVSPNPAMVPPGGMLNFMAQARDENGMNIPIPPNAAWSTQASGSFGTVGPPTGPGTTVTAPRNFSGKVICTDPAAGVSGSADVTVTA